MADRSDFNALAEVDEEPDFDPGSLEIIDELGLPR